jgi:hypothetical protein
MNKKATGTFGQFPQRQLAAAVDTDIVLALSCNGQQQ